MKSTGRYCAFTEELSLDESLDQEMNEEVDNSKDLLKRYLENIDSLLGKKRSKEVKKSMINYLVEQL